MHVSASRLFYKTHCCQRPSKLNFRLKSERGYRWRHRAVTYAATRLFARSIPVKFHIWIVASFFFFSFFIRTFSHEIMQISNSTISPMTVIKKKKILSYESYPRYTLRVIFTKEKLNLQIQRWRDDPRLSVVALVAVRCARKNR